MKAGNDVSVVRAFIREVLTTNMKMRGQIHAPGPQRMGDNLTGHTGSGLLADEEFDTNKERGAVVEKKLAAVCVIISDDDKVLAVSRRNDPTQWGFPGGKVDAGESPREAAARELQEETGLVATRLKRIFVGNDDTGYEVHAFACTVSGEIDTQEEGLIRWVNRSVLLDQSSSPWVEYNTGVFSALGLL